MLADPHSPTACASRCCRRADRTTLANSASLAVYERGARTDSTARSEKPSGSEHDTGVEQPLRVQCLFDRAGQFHDVVTDLGGEVVLSRPTPCSPVMVPPRLMANSATSPNARWARSV